MENINHNVINLNSKTSFNLAEANELLKVVYKITHKYQNQLTQLLMQVDAEQNSNTKALLKIKAKELVDCWNKKIKKLGAKASGIWYADFDFGSGYYCWRFPEKKITYWHSYTEGFKSRKLIDHCPSVTHTL